MTEPRPGGAEGGRSYQLDEILGRGGFGEVYRGHVTGAQGFTKEVAIKVLNVESGQVTELARRLRDEARLLALLRHRAIVQVDDLVQINGRWAVVMEYVPGADLAELVELGPIPLRPVCEIAAEVAGALQSAHEANDPKTGQSLQIVHRDIKPANIRISLKGEVKVLDFGIARARFDRREAETRSLAFGSVGYLAPERWESTDTPAADIYALGVVICESLLGEKVGQLSVDPRKQVVQVEQILQRVQRQLGPEAPAALSALLASTLCYDLEDRPSAGKVEDALHEILLTAPAPWLKRWAPEATAQLGQRRIRPVEEAPRAEAPPEPSSRDSLSWVQPDSSNPLRAVASPPEPAPFVPRPPRTPVRTWVSLGLGILAVGVLALGGVGAAIWALTRTSPAPPPVVKPAVALSPTPALTAPPVAPATPAVIAPPVTTAPPVIPPSPVVKTAKAALPKVCSVQVSGDVPKVALLDARGGAVPLCTAPPGTYHLRATFGNGDVVAMAGALTTMAGKTIAVTCDDSAEQCRW